MQTYSDGKVVNWNEVSADESVEPEHPAPTLALTAADGERPGRRRRTPHSDPADTASAPVADDDHERRRLGLRLAAVCLRGLSWCRC